MDTVNAVCGILNEQQTLFLQYEAATLALLECAGEDAEHYITKRGVLATEIDELNERLAELCAGAQGGEPLLQAAKGRVPFNKVPSEYHPAFYAGQAVQSVGARIMESDKQVTQRLEALRGEALEHIKRHQNLPKIKKYVNRLTDVGDALPRIAGKA